MLDLITPGGAGGGIFRRRGRSGGEFFTRAHVKGIEEVSVFSDNIMLLSSNTGFQAHLQVGPDEFVQLYDMAQAVTAPVLAAAVNSPPW